jgi:hypothetical protein
MGHIERRVWSGKVSYRARYRDPAGRERSKSFDRKADAERWLAEIEHAKARGLWTDPRLGRVRFADWLTSWWSTTTNLRPTTRNRDETLLRLHALPRFGDMPLAAIRQLEVRAWVAELSAKGLAPATVVKAYQLLGKVLAAAVDAGYLAQTPCRNVPLPRIEREEMRFLTQPRSITWPRSSILATRHSWSSAPTAVSASGSWPGSVAPVSICCAAQSPSRRPSPR